MTTVISVENLSKNYHLGTISSGTLVEDLNRWWARVRGRPDPLYKIGEKDYDNREGEIIWALKDVNFQVQQGEVLGIIGRNGAGKSTLLKILSRVTAPTSGRVKVNGRIASLLEVGTGFHPDLTGRENIYLNGAILGMSRHEIMRKFDEIVDFADVEKFIDTPVKRYSSGMYVRLAFAVAAHLEPEILIIDEVLAVGDAEFQKKCLGKMSDVAHEGRTVLFVSHNMAAIENLCSRSLLFNNGALNYSGPTRSVIDHYLTTILNTQKVSLIGQTKRKGAGNIKFTDFHIRNKQGKKIAAITSGENLILAFGYERSENVSLKKIEVGFSIHSTINDQTLCILYNSYTGVLFSDIPRSGFFYCEISNFPFSPGRYRIGARIVADRIEEDWPQDGIGYVDVELGDYYRTGSSGFGQNVPFLIKGQWRVTPNGDA